jgi:hypothetical protein
MQTANYDIRLFLRGVVGWSIGKESEELALFMTVGKYWIFTVMKIHFSYGHFMQGDRSTARSQDLRWKPFFPGLM